MSAHDANLTESLNILQSKQAVVDSILHGKCIFWIGSGVSSERFPKLNILLEELINNLYELADFKSSDCPYQRTISEIINLTSFRDIKTPQNMRPGSPEFPTFVKQLPEKYAEILGLRVNTKDIWWDILKIQEIYSNPSIIPDAEHKFLALLIKEGVLKIIISTNWDTLIEQAHNTCSNNQLSNLNIIACAEECLLTSTDPKLYKIHGCAEKAKNNPGKYKAGIVATSTQRDKWTTDAKAFCDAVQNCFRNSPIIFIGSSGQDHNLRTAHAAAKCGFAIDYNSNRIVFCEEALSIYQKNLLEIVYGEPYKNNQQTIVDAAHIRLFAKPFLGSIYVRLLVDKIQLLANQSLNSQSQLQQLVINKVDEFVTYLKNRYDAINDSKDRWRNLANEIPLALTRPKTSEFSQASTQWSR